MSARQPEPERLTVEQALTRLRQYMERPAPMWSTASYGNSAAESTLTEIGRTLAAEVTRLRAEAAASRAAVLDEAADRLLAAHDNPDAREMYRAGLRFGARITRSMAAEARAAQTGGAS